MAYAPFPGAVTRSDAFLVGKPPGGPAPPPGKAGREVGPPRSYPVNFENGRLKVENPVICNQIFFSTLRPQSLKSIAEEFRTHTYTVNWWGVRGAAFASQRATARFACGLRERFVFFSGGNRTRVT